MVALQDLPIGTLNRLSRDWISLGRLACRPSQLIPSHRERGPHIRVVESCDRINVELLGELRPLSHERWIHHHGTSRLPAIEYGVDEIERPLRLELGVL
ncbi:MAG: hypothetical protein ACREQ5_16180 [Candidatus Dormibacteria bacterium]